ncbi:MAG: 4Fe-4S dicluster domain-containing protein [Desulfovibrionaceae bacterium]|nr:4Fe-4S dicluster domain-containing protein [Desulfovibrionaceae bacterium]
MKNTISLNRLRDPAFLAEVEAQSGQRLSACYQCGNCTAGCPAGFVYDKQANQIMRGVQLGLKDEVLNSRSIWMCLSCSTCSLRCPNNIDVAAVMEVLRHMARKEGRVAVPKVEKFWFSFLDTVRAFGRTYEIGTMALYMLRSMRIFTDLDLAPQALRKRKLGFIPHMIPKQDVPEDGAKAVGRIMQRYKERARREGVRP